MHLARALTLVCRPLTAACRRRRTSAQYVCMFLNNGEPGQLKKVQASVTAARKVFRVMRVSLRGEQHCEQRCGATARRRRRSRTHTHTHTHT